MGNIFVESVLRPVFSAKELEAMKAESVRLDAACRRCVWLSLLVLIERDVA